MLTHPTLDQLHVEAVKRSAPESEPLIGTNGAQCGLDIARMMLAGASAVEMSSAVHDRPGGDQQAHVQILELRPAARFRRHRVGRQGPGDHCREVERAGELAQGADR
jgi:dihydroorotate dehydrogenase